ncbi:MAG: LamG-like jellyroll fold domain-containing protein, partial [Planctomycetota bacterium]
MCKKLIYLVCFVLVLGLTLTSTAGADLIGYWPLDEGAGTTVADVSGRGHNGFFTEGTPLWVEGKYGKALRFDGVNKVEIPDHADFHLEDAVSMALWIKPEADVQPTYAKPFIKQKSGEYPYAIQYAGNGTSIRATVNASARVDTSGIPNFPGEWGHLCMTYDGSAVVLYKDGEEGARNAASGKLQQNDLSLSIGGRLNNAQNFIGICDDVRLFSHALTVEEILQVMEGPPAGPATKPNPAEGATDVLRDVVLSWTPGEFAAPVNGHKVYFSENFSDVNDGIGGIAQDANSYAPQRLDFSKTYYWRVDEVNNVNPESPWTGSVWSFTTELLAYPIENITATASSSDPSKGPENTINGSGLDDSGLLHGKDADDTMWLSSMAGPQPAWIEYEFDGVYKLHEMWVWNSNDSLEQVLGLGFKDVTIEYSVNGTDYTTLGTAHEFARAPGMPDYAHNTTVDFGGVPAKYVRLTANSNWGGILNQYGLSEVRFFFIPVNATEPYPDSGATGVAVDVVLNWKAGREAATHDVYLSTDQQAVIDGTAPVTTVTESSYGPLSLDLGVTHYWKVNEVNEAETPTTWESDLWSFTTSDYIIVDDFESYNDLDPTDLASKRIFNVWLDGYGVATNGSVVGYDQPPFAEQTIVHSDKQSMPFFYANTGGAAYSEAELTLSPPQDWTKHSVKTLSLWFFGDPNNTPGQMYVKVNGTKVAYDGNAGNLLLPSWQVWNIDLASVGTNLQNVTKLAIGIDGSGAAGTLYFDDIRLYVLAPAPVNEWRIADDSDDAEENLAAGGIDLGSSDLELPYEEPGQTNPQIIGVRFAGIPVPKGATITDAWVRFQVDEDKGGTEPVNLIIEGQLSPNPAAFSSTVGDISSRPKTTAQVQWSVPNWTTVGDQGPD